MTNISSYKFRQRGCHHAGVTLRMSPSLPKHVRVYHSFVYSPTDALVSCLKIQY